MPPGHPEPHEFNNEGIGVTYLPLNTMAPIQPLDQGVKGPLRLIAHSTLQKRLSIFIEEDLHREIMKVCNGTNEDAIVVI